HPNDIEGHDEQREERTPPDGEQREESQDSGGQVTVRGEGREASGQIGADHARQDEDESEEAEAVQGRNGALRRDRVHRLELGPDVGGEHQQPGHIAQHEVDSEDGCRRHVGLPPAEGVVTADLRPGLGRLTEATARWYYWVPPGAGYGTRWY